MTAAELDALDALLAKTTPGPWKFVEHNWSDTSIYADERRLALLSIADEADEETQNDLEVENTANSSIIVALHNAAPALIASARREAKMREALHAMLIMSDRGPQPSKFDEALSWRENDIRARELAHQALADKENDNAKPV